MLSTSIGSTRVLLFVVLSLNQEVLHVNTAEGGIMDDYCCVAPSSCLLQLYGERGAVVLISYQYLTDINIKIKMSKTSRLSRAIHYQDLPAHLTR